MHIAHSIHGKHDVVIMALNYTLRHFAKMSLQLVFRTRVTSVFKNSLESSSRSGAHDRRSTTRNKPPRSAQPQPLPGGLAQGRRSRARRRAPASPPPPPPGAAPRRPLGAAAPEPSGGPAPGPGVRPGLGGSAPGSPLAPLGGARGGAAAALARWPGAAARAGAGARRGGGGAGSPAARGQAPSTRALPLAGPTLRLALARRAQ